MHDLVLKTFPSSAMDLRRPRPGFAPSSRAGAPAPRRFVLDDDELLAHFGYFSVAFVGEPWEPGLSFALKIEEMGDYIVAHAEGSIYVCKRAEVVRDHPLTTRAQRPGKIACTVECTAQQVLTLLAGAPADLQASDLQAMQKFLASFRFEAAGYRAFCAARGLRAYEPPADEGSSGMGAKLTSGVGKLTAGASAGISSASRKMSRPPPPPPPPSRRPAPTPPRSRGRSRGRARRRRRRRRPTAPRRLRARRRPSRATQRRPTQRSRGSSRRRTGWAAPRRA